MKERGVIDLLAIALVLAITAISAALVGEAVTNGHAKPVDCVQQGDTCKP